MSNWEFWDVLEAGLASLRTLDARPAKTDRIRARCLATLAKRRGMNRGLLSLLETWRGWLEPAMTLGLSAAYLATAAGSSLALLR